MINQNLILKDVLHVPRLCQCDFYSLAYVGFTLFSVVGSPISTRDKANVQYISGMQTSPYKPVLWG